MYYVEECDELAGLVYALLRIRAQHIFTLRNVAAVESRWSISGILYRDKRVTTLTIFGIFLLVELLMF